MASNNLKYPVQAVLPTILIPCLILLGCLSGCATSAEGRVGAAAPAVAVASPAVAEASVKAAPDAKKISPEADRGDVLGNYLAAENAALNSDSATAATYYLQVLKSDPDNIMLQQRAFGALISSGRFAEAKPVAAALRKEKTATSMPQFFMVLCDIHEGNYKAAEADLATIPAVGFQSLLNPLAEAWILAGEGKIDAAIAALEPLDQTPLFRPFRRNHRALIYAYGGEKAQAELAFKESLTADPRGSLRTILAYGRYLSNAGRGYEAKSLYQKYEKLYPDEASFAGAERQLDQGMGKKPFIANPAEGLAEAFYSMASALTVDSAPAPAAYYLQLATFLKPDFADAYLLLGRLLEVDKNDALAIHAYDQVKPGDILAPEARLRKAWALNDMGQGDAALAIMSDLVRMDPKSMSYQVTLGDMLRAHEKYPDAIEHYNEAIKLAGDLPAKALWVLYYSRGTALERAGRWPEAEADFLKALALSPNQPEVLNYLGYSWVEKGINLEKAEAMLTRAVALRPDDAFVADSLGWALYRQKKYEDAVVILEKSVLEQPGDPTLNDHLGDAYWQVGRHNEARFQWNHAISLGAAPADVLKIEAKLAHGLKAKAGSGAGAGKKSTR